MAEAERIIGTPDIPGAAGAGPEQSDGNAASGDRSGAGAPDPAERPRGKRRIAVLFTVAVLAYALDLVSKMIVVAKLEHHDSIEIIGDWLKFEAIRNAGAAFGFGQAFTIIFTVIAAAVIVVIARLARKLYSVPWAIALGLLLGGALGNLTDRVFRSPGVFEGAVVDFIAPKHFAVFNLADSAIVCGGILIVLLSFRGLDPDGTVHKD
ncbi:signal peptidase II [Streptomyces sp. NPDC091209]|uniref:signal peptidase II n=1 Tax=Streptomyces sp. NPDC091209 TaxID=3365974 RepID=UPI00380A155C